MEGLPIYHGVATLIPGMCLILVAAVAFLPSDIFNAASAGSFSLKDVAVLLPLSTLASYLVGIVTWDLAYYSTSLSLFPFYWRKKDLDPRYRQRLKEANKVLEASDAPTTYAYTNPHYLRFLADLVRVTETHKEYLGQRVSAEWERLSLYCTMAFSCKLALLLIVAGIVIGRILGYTPTLVQNPIALWTATACTVLLGLAVPLAFSRRNGYLGRDVGLGIADQVRQSQDNDSEYLVVVDFDGVLADTNAEKAKLVKSHFGKTVDPRRCSRSFSVPHVLSEQEYESLAEIVYSAPSTLETRAITGAVEAIMMLRAAGWKVAVLTARQEDHLVAARRWLRQRFGPAAPCTHSSARFSQSKAEWAAGVGALAIVDDDPRHLIGTASTISMRFLFKPPEEAIPPEGVTVVQGWNDLLEHLSELEPCAPEETR